MKPYTHEPFTHFGIEKNNKLFQEALIYAGLPKGVSNYVPGSGAKIGDYLVDHPKTRFVSLGVS